MADAKEKNLYPGKSDVQIRNAIIDADNKEFEKIRTDAYSKIDALAKDRRLNIDVKEAKNAIDREFEEDILILKHKPKAVEKLVSKETDIIKLDAVKAYARKSGIASIVMNDKNGMSETIDYIEGVSWAKENIGFDCDILSLGGEDMGDHVMATTFITDYMETSMRLNTLFFGENRKIDSERNNGFNIRNLSAQSTGVHESAHVIEADIANKAKPDTDYAYSVFELHAVSKEIMKRANKAVGGDAESNARAVSEYATKNTSEAFAECMADCYANGEDAQALSKAALKVIKEEREDIIKTIGENTSWWE